MKEEILIPLIPTSISGDVVGLTRSSTPLLDMKAHPVDSSPSGFISPPIEQVVQYENYLIPYTLSSSRCFGLQGVA